MNTKNTPAEPLRSFYTPRKRVYAPDYLVNPVTGEMTVPPSMTEQSHLPQCDINNIIKSFSKSGQIAHINANAAKGVYADLPDTIDYQESLNLVMAAEASFATLPSKVRDRFGNDPASFLSFMSDPQNEQEARQLGLLNPKAPDPQPEPKTSPAPEKPA